MTILELPEKQNQKRFFDLINLALKDGKVVAYPTETCYGLAADPANLKAIERLYKIKGRSYKKPISLIFAHKNQIKDWVIVDSTTKKIIRAFWPGPLTLVLPISKKNKFTKKLNSGKDNLGVRVSSSLIAKILSKNFKNPITATSANVSGKPDCYTAEEVYIQYKNKKLKPDILIQVNAVKKVKPSTVVKVLGNNFEILRQGDITKKQIQKVIK